MQPNKKEAYPIAGDHSVRTSFTGANLTNSTLVKPIVLWRDRLLTLDVYAVEGAPPYIILFCPLCRRRDPDSDHSLRICGDNKKIDLAINAIPNIPGFTTPELVQYLGLPGTEHLRGRISVETFGCSWESDPTSKKEFGFGVCGWRVKIDDNIAREVCQF